MWNPYSEGPGQSERPPDWARWVFPWVFPIGVVLLGLVWLTRL